MVGIRDQGGTEGREKGERRGREKGRVEGLQEILLNHVRLRVFLLGENAGLHLKHRFPAARLRRGGHPPAAARTDHAWSASGGRWRDEYSWCRIKKPGRTTWERKSPG